MLSASQLSTAWFAPKFFCDTLIMMHSALLNAARGDIGLQPPRARNPSDQPQLTQHAPAEGLGHANDAAPHGPSVVVGEAHPEVQQPPAATPLEVDPPQQRALGLVANLSRGRLRLRGRATIILALVALLWLLSAPVVCPRTDNHVQAGQRSHDGPAGRYKGPTVMFARSVGYLRFFERRRSRGTHTHNSDAIMAASGIEQKTAELETGEAALKGKFESVDLLEANAIRYLEASLSRGRDEAAYYSSAVWYWPLRLACSSCGYMPWTLPCPDHPVTIARREAREAIGLLLKLGNNHEDLRDQHRDLQDNQLKPGYHGVCNIKDFYTGAGTARGGEQVGSGGQATDSGLRDFLSMANGMCVTTGAQLQKGVDFREQQMSKVITKFSAAAGAINKASQDLEKAYAGTSWNSAHIALGIHALDKLLAIVEGLKSATPTTLDTTA